MNRFSYLSISPIHGDRRGQDVKRFINAAQDGILSESQRAELVRNAAVIDVLAPSTVGLLHDQLFPIESVVALDELIERVRSLLEDFDQRLKSAESPEEIYDVYIRSRRLKQNLQALFAVLYTRNQSQLNEEGHAPTSEIADFLKREARDELIDAAAGALLLSFVTALAFSLIMQCLYSLEIRPNARIATVLVEDWSIIVRDSLTSTMPPFLLLLIATRLVIFVRRNQIDAQRWPQWQLWRIPFSRALVISLAPALVASLALYIALNARDALENLYANGRLPSPELYASSARLYIDEGIRAFVAATLVCMITVFIADLHHQHKMRHTVLLAAAGVVPLAVTTFIFSNPSLTPPNGAPAHLLFFLFRDFIILNFFAALFLILFAIWVEAAEESESNDATEH